MSVFLFFQNITDELVLFSVGVEERTVFDVLGNPIGAELLGYNGGPQTPRSVGFTADYNF